MSLDLPTEYNHYSTLFCPLSEDPMENDIKWY